MPTPQDNKAPKKKAKKAAPSSPPEIKISEADTTSLPVAVEEINALAATLIGKIEALNEAAQKLTRTPIMGVSEHWLQDTDLRLEYQVRLIGVNGEIFRIAGPSTFSAILDPEVLPEALHNFQHVIQAGLFRPMMARFGAYLNTVVVRRPDPALLSDSSADVPFTTQPPAPALGPVIDDTAERPPQPGGSAPGDQAPPSGPVPQ